MADSSEVTINERSFTCYRLNEARFNDVAAVYVIICVDENSNWDILDVGETGELGDRVLNHDRSDCWERNCPNNNIWVCVYPMPTQRYTQRDRLNLEASIRLQHNPPCGSR